MLEDLRVLFRSVGPAGTRKDYGRSIIDHNVLGKPTKKARELAARHMATLYGLEVENPIYRALRRLWDSNEQAQPVLALSVALARDPLLRETLPFFVQLAPGAVSARAVVEASLAAANPDRFSHSSLKSFAQNVAGTWTSAGVLQGRTKKVRVQPAATPEAMAMLLFLGFLEGRTGQRLFTSDWTSVLGCSSEELEALAASASHRGLLVFMNAGGVKEVRFPGYLTPEEERIRQEVAHVT